MRSFIILIALFFLSFHLSAQNKKDKCNQMFREARDSSSVGNYSFAIDKLSAIKIVDETMENKVDAEIKRLYKEIDRKRIEAQESRDSANIARKKEAVARIEAQKQTKIAVKERNLALIGESRVLAKQAEDAIEQGDVSQGISLAKEALIGPTQMWDRPYVPSAEAALIHGICLSREKSVFISKEAVKQVDLSPNGDYLLTLSNWGEVRLWDARKTTFLKLLYKNVTSIYDGAEAANFISFDSTGKRILVIMMDHTIRLLDLATGRETKLIGHRASVNYAAFSPDGSIVGTASSDSTIKVWNCDDGQLITTLIGHNASVNHLEFDILGKQIISSSDDKTVRLWSIGDWSQMMQVKTNSFIRFSHFSPDCKSFLVVPKLGYNVIGEMIKNTPIVDCPALVSIKTGKTICKLFGHTNCVNDAEFSEDGGLILTVSDDGSARIWSSSKGELIETHRDLPDEAYVSINGMTAGKFINHGQRFITIGNDSKIRIWTIGEQKATVNISVHENGISSLALSRDQSLFVTGSYDKTIRLWTTNNLNDLSVISPTDRNLVQVKGILDTNLFRYRPTLISSDSATIVQIKFGSAYIKLTNRKQSIKLDGHTARISAATFSADGNYIVTVCGRVASTLGFGIRSVDTTARVWDAHTGQELVVLDRHMKNVEKAKFNPKFPSMLATASLDGKVRIWRLPEGKLLRTFGINEQPIFDISFSPDGKSIVAASSNGKGYIWNLENEKATTTLSGHLAAIEHIEFSPNGSLILTASNDGTARIWNAVTGDSIKTLKCGSDLNFATFLAAGTRVATATINPGKYVGDGAFGSFLNERMASRSILIWDVSSGEKLQDFPHEDSIDGIYITKDGKEIFTKTKNMFRLWKPFLTTQDVISASRNFTVKKVNASEVSPR